jgi:hypothetical protein
MQNRLSESLDDHSVQIIDSMSPTSIMLRAQTLTKCQLKLS